METVPCPHCGDPIKPTATFCLACDSPVVDTSRGLSVAEVVAAPPRFPVVGIAVTLAMVLALGGGAFWAFNLYRNGGKAASTKASADVSRAVRLLVSAEAGHAAACRDLGKVSALQSATAGSGSVAGTCQALVGHDAGAHLDSVAVDSTHLSTEGETGTAQVRATVTDATGTHHVDRTVALVQSNKDWILSWDGRPLV